MKDLGVFNFMFCNLFIIFPHLYKEISLRSLYCKVCQMVQHIRLLYPISEYQSNKLFALVYSDV